MVEKMKTPTDTAQDLLPSRGGIDVDNLASISTNAFLILLCVISSLVSFWDIKFTFDKAFTVGWVAVLLYMVSTTVYRTKYDGGLYQGKQTKAFMREAATKSSTPPSIINITCIGSIVPPII